MSTARSELRATSSNRFDKNRGYHCKIHDLLLCCWHENSCNLPAGSGESWLHSVRHEIDERRNSKKCRRKPSPNPQYDDRQSDPCRNYRFCSYRYCSIIRRNHRYDRFFRQCGPTLAHAGNRRNFRRQYRYDSYRMDCRVGRLST